MRRVPVTMLRWFGMLLYAMGLHRIVIWWHRKDVKVLAFHACEAAESAATLGLSGNTTPAQFTAMLAFLRRHYNVVPLEAIEKGVCPPRAVAITFDDGYRSVYENAFPILKSYGFPATLYVVTSAVGNSAMIWVNELNWLLRTQPGALAHAARSLGIPADAQPETVVARARDAYDPVALRALLAELRAMARVDAATLAASERLHLTWDQIAEMVRCGFTIGSHTATHPNLARLDESAQYDEMASAWEELRNRPGATRSLAYPFGLYGPTSERAASALPCSSVMTSGGINRPLDLRRVARVPIGAGGPATLFAIVELVEPAKAQLRRWLRGHPAPAASAATDGARDAGSRQSEST